ncbi:MAG: 16S rRNA (cytidine(1402)-2'-O)-methyltransferase [Longimicrobiales bacterium]
MGEFYVVATPIGNLSDFSHRATEVLQSVDLILAEDTRRTAILMNAFDVKTPLKSLNAHNEDSRIPEVLGRLEEGKTVALVSDAGTPLISDPGDRLLSSVIGSGHQLYPIPGPSAILPALVASGFSCVPFSFFGFIPKKGRQRKQVLSRLISSTDTIVLFESPNRLLALVEDLMASGQRDRNLVVAREMTKIHEEFFRGTASETLEYFSGKKIKGEITVVVAPVKKEDTGISEDKLVAAEILSEAYLNRETSPSEVARKVSTILGV